MASSAPKAAFDVGRMAMGGFGQMLDGVEFVKRAWSSTLNLPGTLVPTVDIDELDRRIADLKAVEQWLNVNLSMLRGTVQALEIQRGTLAAVKAFGTSLGQASPGTVDADAAAALRRAMAEMAPHAAGDAAASGAAPGGGAAAASAPGPAAAPAARRPTRRAPPREAARTAATSTSAPPLPGINPGVWWNLLQQNFNQVAEAALSGVGLQAVATTGATKSGAGAPRTAPEPAAPAKAVAGATRAGTPARKSGGRTAGGARGRTKPADAT